MSSSMTGDHEPEGGRPQPRSWLERHILPPREGESRLVRELKGFARTGLVVIPVFMVFDVGRSQGWW
jgi:hypothetical protein